MCSRWFSGYKCRTSHEIRGVNGFLCPKVAVVVEGALMRLWNGVDRSQHDQQGEGKDHSYVEHDVDSRDK